MIKRGLALVLLLDGALTALKGRSFLRWMRQRLPDRIDPLVNWFMGWPRPFLRAGAAMQTVMALLVLLRGR